jgi:hypothetical protein
MMPTIPFSDPYVPPWTVVPCGQFEGKWMIVDTKAQVVAFGLSRTLADDWKNQLDTTGHIDHDPS